MSSGSRHGANGQMVRRGGTWIQAGNSQYSESKYSGKRLREQASCRAYWASVYGKDAERDSRGGVSWLR